MDHHQKSTNKFTSKDKLYSAIGRFIFEFSQLEYTLRARISERVGLEDSFFDTIMSHDFSMLCNIAERLLLGAPAPAAIPAISGNPPSVLQQHATSRAMAPPDVKKIIADCREIGDKRNRVVHGLWYITGKDGVLHHSSRQKLISTQYISGDGASRLAEMADKALTLRQDVEHIFNRI